MSTIEVPSDVRRMLDRAFGRVGYTIDVREVDGRSYAVLENHGGVAFGAAMSELPPNHSPADVAEALRKIANVVRSRVAAVSSEGCRGYRYS